ncbi:pilin [Patescibacteria group bacterium]
MKKGISRMVFLFIFIVSIVFIFGNFNSVSALECPAGTEQDRYSGVCLPVNTGLPDPAGENPMSIVITNFMKWILSVFGVLAIIAFAISGVQYLTAVGDSDKAETAKKQMVWSIMGVVVGLLGYVIIQAIDTMLRGQSTTF